MLTAPTSLTNGRYTDFYTGETRGELGMNEVNTLLDFVDKDGSGTIDYGEFTKVRHRPHPSTPSTPTTNTLTSTPPPLPGAHLGRHHGRQDRQRRDLHLLVRT